MFKTPRLFALLFLALMISCGKSSSGGSSEKGPTLQTISGLSHEDSRGSQTLYSQCTPYKNNTAAIHKLTLKSNGAGTEFEWTVSYYTTNCRVYITDVVLQGHGVFQDNENKKMEATLESAVFISRNEDVTREFNKEGTCGRHYWQTNVPMDVLNTSCVKNPKNDFYFDVKGDTITLYSCDNQEPLSKKCDVTQFRKGR